MEETKPEKGSALFNLVMFVISSILKQMSCRPNYPCFFFLSFFFFWGGGGEGDIVIVYIHVALVLFFTKVKRLFFFSR